MGKNNKSNTWGLFGHAQFNVNNYTAVFRYDVGDMYLLFLTVALLLEGY